MVDLDRRAVVLEYLGDGADGVLRRLDVLDRAALAIADHLKQERYGGGARLRVLSAAVHGHHAGAVAGRLTHVGRLVDDLLEQTLQEELLVLDGLRSAELDHVVPHAQRPLPVRIGSLWCLCIIFGRFSL